VQIFGKSLPSKPTLMSLLALTALVVAGGIWQQNLRLPEAAQIEQWSVLAGVQDKEATQALQKAAQGGSALAARALGQIWVQRTDETTVLEGQALLKQAAQAGDARADLLLGKLLFKGAPGIPAQATAAIPWLEAAVKGGQLGAAHYLGMIYRQNLPEQARSPEKALHWLEVAAKAGFADSQFLLGQMIMTGDGTAADPETARKWFEAAAEQDHPEANLELLMAYTRNEMGLKSNAEAEARQWMEAQHSLRHRPPPP
jgi:TPR repeat protein